MFVAAVETAILGRQCFRPDGRVRSLFDWACENITRDRIRLIMQSSGSFRSAAHGQRSWGLLIGFAITSSSLVDRAQADLWIVPRGAKDVDQRKHA